MLADHAITRNSTQSSPTTNLTNDIPSPSHHEYQLNEALSLLPHLQHGMDVNPKFTAGPTGMEYTHNLAALDSLGVELVHGWLVDPQDGETWSAVGNRSYNELIELVIWGKEAREEVGRCRELILRKEACLVALEKGGVLECGSGEEKQQSHVSSGNDANVALSSFAMNEKDSSTENPENDEKDNPINHAPLTEKEMPNQSDEVTLETETDDNANDTKVPLSSCTAHEKDTPAENPENDDKGNPTNHAPLSNEETSTLQDEIAALRSKISSHSDLLSQSEIIHDFLTTTSHQLTYHGLEQLHTHLSEDALCVFFRNNHFATLTKHNGILYLLVTDLGYAHTPEIVWEKLDVIDGDTEYANEFFCRPNRREELVPEPTTSPEWLLAQRGQTEKDYQLALALSGTSLAKGEHCASAPMDTEISPEKSRVVDVDRSEVALAWQREQERMDHESEQLARQLQELEYSRERTRGARPAAAASSSKSASSGCVVS
eukprot:CCRYP_010632-RA/>CCRYP_010632-RA protein AED:0.00 eAED:0.00 QI:564/-1/1/1/-1/1/1/419/488